MDGWMDERDAVSHGLHLSIAVSERFASLLFASLRFSSLLFSFLLCITCADTYIHRERERESERARERESESERTRT